MEENKIQTAENLLRSIMSCLNINLSIAELNEADPELVPFLIDEINGRTKLHVVAALKAASEKVKTKTHEEYISKSGEFEYTQYPDKDSILNAYSLENIK